MVWWKDFKDPHPWVREDGSNGFTFLEVREHFRGIWGPWGDRISTVKDIPNLVQLGLKGEVNPPHMWRVKDQFSAFQNNPAKDPILNRLIRSGPENF